MKLANAAVNAEADTFAALLNGGTLKIYNGTQPATADTAVSGQTLLATFTLPNPAFGSAVAGVVTLNAVTEVSAVASGTATWARWEKSDSTPVMDTTVGVSGADLIINNNAIVVDNTVQVLSFTYTRPKE